MHGVLGFTTGLCGLLQSFYVTLRYKQSFRVPCGNAIVYDISRSNVSEYKSYSFSTRRLPITIPHHTPIGWKLIGRSSPPTVSSAHTLLPAVCSVGCNTIVSAVHGTRSELEISTNFPSARRQKCRGRPAECSGRGSAYDTRSLCVKQRFGTSKVRPFSYYEPVRVDFIDRTSTAHSCPAMAVRGRSVNVDIKK